MTPTAVPPEFRKIELLGQGSTGTVYLVEERASGETFALKIFAAACAHEAGRRLLRECATLAHLRHPALCAVVRYGTTADGVPYVLKEYVPGKPLEPGPPGRRHEARVFLRPVLDTLAALAFLHHHGFAGLDLQPENVVERKDGRGVLIDVGLGLQAGGPQAERKGTHAADVYAAGLLLLHRLTGAAKAPAQFPAIAHWDHRLTLHLERIAQRAVAPAPGQSFETADALLTALCRVLGADRNEVLGVGENSLFVGPAKAQADADKWQKRLERGEGACLCLRGKPGMGKSRMLHEVAERAKLAGVRTLAWRFFPHAPFSPRECAVSLLNGQADDGSRWEGGNPEALARRFWRELGAAAGAPGAHVLVTVDDFQNADPLGREFFLAGVRLCAQGGAKHPFGLLLASTDPQPPGVETTTLQPLGRGDAARLLEQLMFPLRASAAVRRHLHQLCRGNPQRIHAYAGALSRGGAALPDCALLFRDQVPPQDEEGRSLLRFLSVFARPVSLAELGCASGLGTRVIARTLAALGGLVAAEGKGEGARRRFSLASDSVRHGIDESLSPREARRLHRACARAVERTAGKRKDAVTLASLVRHYALSGNTAQAASFLADATQALVRDGNTGRACALAALLAERDPSPQRRIEHALLLSDLAAQSGQHDLACKALAAALTHARGSRRGRLMRRLGIHHHLLGNEKKALELFERVFREYDPRKDLAELLEADAEHADMLISRGRFEEAQKSLARGLANLRVLERERGRPAIEQEITLRAIAGRLHLRKLAFEDAVRELRRALRLARGLRDERSQASILNNLAVAHNQRNEFASARRMFLAAECLSRRRGNEEVLLHIFNNLAVLDAKRGVTREAEKWLERARGCLAEVAGERPRFFADQAETVAMLTLGQAERAEVCAREAIRVGSATGDLPHVRFLEVYLAEALLERARYDDAERVLRPLVAHGAANPALGRMIDARLALVHARRGKSEAARKLIAARSEASGGAVAYLDAWNDFFLGMAQECCGDDGRRLLVDARAQFVGFGVPFGAARAACALLAAACRHRDEGAARTLVRQLESERLAPHGILDVELPLACAEAGLFLGEVERAREHLHVASGAIVGRSLPELDLRIELAWAQLALLAGDLPRAQQHRHRAVTLRAHLGERLSGNAREEFLGQRRWDDLRELEGRFALPAAASAPAREEDSYGIIAHSAAMRGVLESVRRIGPRDLSALVAGPTGSGKDLVARALHAIGPRRDAPFVVIHVPSLRAELFESELFGFVKGAFTGAERDHTGLLLAANGGTAYFDEIDALEPVLQAKLLRCLDRREIRPVGSTEVYALDVRFLASTTKDLRAPAARGEFREDLYWRIAQAEITVPPLRERKEDLPELVALLVRKHWRLGTPAPVVGPEALELLRGLAWPGNVRQLETALLRALLAWDDGKELTAEALTRALASPPRREPFSDDLLAGKDLPELHRSLDIAWLCARFADFDGNMTALATSLGMTRSSLYKWLRRLGVDPNSWRGHERG